MSLLLVALVSELLPSPELSTVAAAGGVRRKREKRKEGRGGGKEEERRVVTEGGASPPLAFAEKIGEERLAAEFWRERERVAAWRRGEGGRE